MKRMHNKIVVAVATGKVTFEVCLEQAGSTLGMPARPQIDKTAREGP